MEIFIDHKKQHTLDYKHPVSRKRREMARKSRLLPIAIRATVDVESEVYDGVVRGIEYVRDLSNQERKIFSLGNTRDGKGRFCDPESYLESATLTQTLQRESGFGPQVDANELLKVMQKDPRQRYPHWLVLVVGTDMFYVSEGQPVDVYGLAFLRKGVAVLSQKRLIEQVTDPQLLQTVATQLAMHEGGHLFGLLERTTNTTVSNGRHCTNECVLQQGKLLDGLPVDQQSLQTAAVTGSNTHKTREFCSDCVAELQQKKSKYHSLEGTNLKETKLWGVSEETILNRFYNNLW